MTKVAVTTVEWYSNYLRSPRWRMIRFLRRKLDGQRCRLCNNDQHLETHHRRYDNRGRPGLFGFLAELRDCITVCDNCHKTAHRQRIDSNSRQLRGATRSKP